MSFRDRTDAERALQRWPSRNLEQLFEDLAELGHRWKEGDEVRVPRVTLFLRSGREVTGFVLDVYGDRAGGRTVLIRSPAAAHPAGVDVTHVPWATLDAVTVHDVAAWDRPPADAPPPPTREELLARAASATEALAEKVGTPIAFELELGDDEAALEPLGWLLRLAQRVLLEVAAAPASADALRGRVKAVKLALGIQPLTSFADGSLIITTPSAWNKRATAQSLRRELEALL